VAFFAF